MSFSPDWEFIKTVNLSSAPVANVKTTYGSAGVAKVNAPLVEQIVVPDAPGRSHAVRIAAAALGAACLWVATRD